MPAARYCADPELVLSAHEWLGAKAVVVEGPTSQPVTHGARAP